MLVCGTSARAGRPRNHVWTSSSPQATTTLCVNHVRASHPGMATRQAWRASKAPWPRLALPTRHSQRCCCLLQAARGSLDYGNMKQRPQPQQQQPQQADTRHLVVPRGGGLVSSVVATVLGDVTADRAKELIAIGAVYHAELPPRPPPHLGPQAHATYAAEMAEAAPDGVSPPSFRGTPPKPRRLADDEAVAPGSYLRVHLKPQCFPRAQQVDWRSRVVDETRDYVVLDKPAGVPVAATLDNAVDNCVEHLTRALQLPTPVLPTHRLDICTEGLLVMAKTKEFAAHFQALLRARQVRKLYAAVTVAAPPLGTLVHWSSDSKRAPQTFLRSAPPGDPRWKRCDLYIFGQRQVALPPASVLRDIGCEADELFCGPSLPGSRGAVLEHVPGWPERAPAAVHYDAGVGGGGCDGDSALLLCESLIRLGTGRTHQIRGQLAVEGCPLLGDKMYGPPLLSSIFPRPLQSGLLLHDSRPNVMSTGSMDTEGTGTMASFRSRGEEAGEEDASYRRVKQANAMTITAIGLKAVELSWKGGPVYEAGPPWWRANT
eukprot:jgi/Mesvir1/16671/Mv15073-RA.1